MIDRLAAWLHNSPHPLGRRSGKASRPGTVPGAWFSAELELGKQQMFVSPYVFAILTGLTLLVTLMALGWLGFGKEPDRNYNDPIGPAGANLAHSLLTYLRPVSVGILITGCVGLLGEIAGQPPLRTMA